MDNDPLGFGSCFTADAVNEAVRISKQFQQKRKSSGDGDGSFNEEVEEDGGEDIDGT